MTIHHLDDDGTPVLSYTLFHQSTPTAENATALTDLDHAVSVVIDQLAGWWFASDDDELIDALLDAGATVERHAHLHRRPIVREDRERSLPSPGDFHLLPLVASATEISVVSAAAYGSSHPDHDVDHDTEGELEKLLAGELVGPFMSDASWQVEDNGVLVGVVVVNYSEGEGLFGGPWVSDVMRLPGARYRGLGTTLLEYSIHELAAAGETSLSLVVTEGNSARSLYERLGFAHESSRRKLAIPPRPHRPRH